MIGRVHDRPFDSRDQSGKPFFPSAIKAFLAGYLSVRKFWESFSWYRANEAGLEGAIRNKIHNYHNRGMPKGTPTKSSSPTASPEITTIKADITPDKTSVKGKHKTPGGMGGKKSNPKKKKPAPEPETSGTDSEGSVVISDEEGDVSMVMN